MKILLWLLLLPLTLIFAAFAIANRHAVTLSFDPAPLSIEVPLYGLVFAGIFAGLTAGGLITWLRAGRWRRQLRVEQRTVRRLEEELRAGGNDSMTPDTGAVPKSGATAVVEAA